MKKLDFKINKIVKDKTLQAKKDYLQIYFDLVIDDSGEPVVKNGSFFVSNKKMNIWESEFSELIQSRDEHRILELEAELAKLKSKK